MSSSEGKEERSNRVPLILPKTATTLRPVALQQSLIKLCSFALMAKPCHHFYRGEKTPARDWHKYTKSSRHFYEGKRLQPQISINTEIKSGAIAFTAKSSRHFYESERLQPQISINIEIKCASIALMVKPSCSNQGEKTPATDWYKCRSFPWLQSKPCRNKGRRGLAAAVVTCLLVLLSSSYPYRLRHSLLTGLKGEFLVSWSNHVIQPATLKLAIQGETTKVEETTEVYIFSAFKRKESYLPQNSLSSQTTVVLVAWATNRQGIDRQDFVCCLSPSLDFTHTVIQAHAVPTFHIRHSTFVLGVYVDMYRASFTCQLPTDLRVTSRDDDVKDNVTSRRNPGVVKPSEGAATVNYVAFAQRSCNANMTDTAHRIEQPEEGKVAVCVGYVHGQPNLERLMEWLELARVLGVSRVQIFHSGVSDPVLHVLRHYNSTGFLFMRPVTIPHRPEEPQRDFTENEPQAWTDKDVLLEDCMHRLSDHDFVIHQDLDELLIPSPPFPSLHHMLQAAVGKEPRAAAFHINTFLSLSHWPETDPARPITFLRRLDRTVSNTLDNHGWGKSSPKVIYRPDRVGRVSTHDVSHIRHNSTVELLPDSSYRFIHYRNCKPQLWGTCHMERERDESLLRFESQWLAALARLPLARLGLSEKYISAIIRAAGGNSTQ